MSTTAAVASLQARLAAVVGEENLVADPEALMPRAIDGVLPGLSVAPGSAEELASVLRLAWENDLVVVPMAGATRLEMGGVPERVGMLLQTHRLNAIERYDPGDLTISVGAGITLSELNRALAVHRQFLPIDAAEPERASIGGSLASAASGPLKHFYGGPREFCVGVKFATADGKLAKGGGHVVKNVAGYDMMKLLIGSFGTLAVIVSASFKLFPCPRQTRTFSASFASMDEALKFQNGVVRSALSPMCLEVVSPEAHAFIRKPGGPCWRVLVRAGGSDAVLARYRTELGSAVTEEITQEAGLWSSLSDFAPRVVAQQARAMILQISVLRQSVADALKAAASAAAEQSFACAIIGRVGIGSLLAALIPIGGESPSVVQYVNAVSSLRAGLPRESAAVVVHCPSEAKRYFDVWGSTPTDLAAMRVIKRALDEKNILNRGRFLV